MNWKVKHQKEILIFLAHTHGDIKLMIKILKSEKNWITQIKWKKIYLNRMKSLKQQFTLTHSFSLAVVCWPWATITTHVVQVRTSYKKLHWLRVHSQSTCCCLFKQEFQQTTSAVTILNESFPLQNQRLLCLL